MSLIDKTEIENVTRSAVSQQPDFIHIFQGYFTGSGTSTPQYQWSKPGGCEYIDHVKPRRTDCKLKTKQSITKPCALDIHTAWQEADVLRVLQERWPERNLGRETVATCGAPTPDSLGMDYTLQYNGLWWDLAGWPKKTIGHLFYTTSNFVHHFKAIYSYSPETPNSCQIWCDLEIKNNRAPLLCYLKRCASFRSHQWIQTGVKVRKRPIWVKMDDFFVLCDLEIWRMTMKNNRAPLQYHIIHCVSFHRHIWIQTKLRSGNG